MAGPTVAKQISSEHEEERPETPAPKPRRPGLLRPRYFLIGALALAALAFGAHEVHQRLTHVYEYDARITTDLITISSRSDGVITELPIREGDRIEREGVLAQIDSRASLFRMQGLEAQVAGIAAERAQLQAERRMLEEQVTSRIGSRESGIAASQASLAAIDAEMELARAELDRARTLFERRITSRRALDQAQSNLRRLEGERRRILAQTQEARQEMRGAEAELTKLAVIDTQIQALDHRVAELEAELSRQRVDLEDRTIRSPIDGIIDRIFVEAGEYMSVGQRMLLIHDPENVWVEANIKETSIDSLKIGQPVVITVDAYGGQSFSGRVEHIGSSTTSNFALLPTPNPSGNFTKITQRVPVRISIDGQGKALSPGMMVEVNIDIRDR